MDRTPASDAIEGTAAVWIKAAEHGRVWDRQRDVPRVREAFARLAADRIEWPKPRDFLDALPPVPAPPRLTYTRKPAAPEKVERIARTVGELLRSPVQHARREPPKRHTTPEQRAALEAEARERYARLNGGSAPA